MKDISNSVGALPCNIVLCLPSIFLSHSSALEGDVVSLGGQDCSNMLSGAYTGDISAEMLIDIGCKYVIVGHSERRKYHNESNNLILCKAQSAIRAGLIPIICVGETEKCDNNIELLRQCEECFPDSGNFIIAYEPCWAIGTGKVPSNSDIETSCSMIKKHNVKMPIIYGGSVTVDNVKDILKCNNLEGVLVGGASLNYDSFSAILHSVQG